MFQIDKHEKSFFLSHICIFIIHRYYMAQSHFLLYKYIMYVHDFCYKFEKKHILTCIKV